MVFVNFTLMSTSSFITIKFSAIFICGSISSYIKLVPFDIPSQSYANKTSIAPYTYINFFLIISFKVNTTQNTSNSVFCR